MDLYLIQKRDMSIITDNRKKSTCAMLSMFILSIGYGQWAAANSRMQSTNTCTLSMGSAL